MTPLIPLALVVLGAAALSGGKKGGGKMVAVNIIDYRDKAKDVVYPSTGNKKRYLSRNIKDVRGIVLHQTGVHNHAKSTYHKITAHLVAAPDGKAYWNHPFTTNLMASNGFNKSSIAIEVPGNFRGVEANPNSYWKPGGGPTTLTKLQAQAIRDAIDFAIAETKRQGGQVEYIAAHRQSLRSRSVDPGEAIWRAAGLYAQQRYGLRLGKVLGDGLAIPVEWGQTPNVAMEAPATLTDPSEVMGGLLGQAAGALVAGLGSVHASLGELSMLPESLAAMVRSIDDENP